MAQPRPGSLLLPTLEQSNSSPQLSWTTTPSSGYGTEYCTPTTPEEAKDSLTTWANLKDDCCTLTNPTWRNPFSSLNHQGGEAAEIGHDTTASGQSIYDIPSTAGPPHRDYSVPIVKRAIVTLDAEHIGPDDKLHHPLDKPSSEIFLRKPWGIAANKYTEQIYITDRQHHTILVFGPDGEYQGKFGGPGMQPGLFNRPTGIGFDAVHNRIIVVDKDNHRIQVFCAITRKFLFTFGSKGRKPGQFSYPWGIAVSPDGSRIAVTDTRNHRIQLFTSDGDYDRHFTIWAKVDYVMSKDRFRTIVNQARGIVFDSTGTFVYVTDFNLHRLYRLNIVSGEMGTIVEGHHLYRPSGIDVDAAGNVLVCDTRHHLIKIFRPDGQPVGYVKNIGGFGLDLPLDITVMRAGHIAVLDLNGRVRVF